MKIRLLLLLLFLLIVIPTPATSTSAPDAQSSQQYAKTKKKRGLFIGDSITDGGWGRSGGSMAPSKERNHHDLNHIYGHSFVMLAISQLTAEEPDLPYEWANRGISGNTLTDLEVRWDEDALTPAPDVVTILVGINDVLSQKGGKDIDATDWHRRYRTLIDRTREKNPDVKFVLITPFVYPRRNQSATEYAAERAVVDRLAREVRALAEETGSTLVDANRLYEPLCNRDGADHWIWDGVHPSPAGHYVLAQWWLNAIKGQL